MKGVTVKPIKLAHSDERRDILEIMNGQLNIRNMKVLKIKKGEQLLGNHWHQYSECMYLLKGSAHYVMENIDTGEKEEFDLKEGDVVFRSERIIHAGIFKEDSIIIDAATESYLSADFNDIPKKIL